MQVRKKPKWGTKKNSLLARLPGREEKPPEFGRLIKRNMPELRKKGKRRSEGKARITSGKR